MDYLIAVSEAALNGNSLMGEYCPSDRRTYRADRDAAKTGKSRGGGTLLGVSPRLKSFRLIDLECAEKCIEKWIEIKIMEGVNLLTENHYFRSNTPPDIMNEYFYVRGEGMGAKVVELYYYVILYPRN